MGIRLHLVRRVTDEELLALLQRNPGYRVKRAANGMLVVIPTGGESGLRSGEAFGQLRAWNRRSGLACVFDASTGFRLPDGSLLSPDASWVRRERWEALPQEGREGFPPLCPDVVFEVRSTAHTPADARTLADSNSLADSHGRADSHALPESRRLVDSRTPAGSRTLADSRTSPYSCMSPDSHTSGELPEKTHAYLANGAHLAVLVDPEAHGVEARQAGGEPARYCGTEPVPLEPELPGFLLDPAPIFA